jgi:hypothetical protein
MLFIISYSEVLGGLYLKDLFVEVVDFLHFWNENNHVVAPKWFPRLYAQ